MTSRTLICCAFPFGYGPAAKLLHLARGLRDLGLRLVFLGTGIAHELAARSTLFDEILPAKPADERARQLIGSAAGVLSLMDRDFAAVTVELNRPLFVADSLLWMRDQVPPVFRHAQRYWAQEFDTVGQRLAEAGPNATVVGPIVAPDCSARAARGSHRVVNLGGSETPQGWARADPGFFDFVIRALDDPASPIRPASDVYLLAGSECICYLRQRYPTCGLTMASAPHEESLTLLATARYVITAPGLTACLECFQRGVPTFFLPPQNYSQWWILKKLPAQGLAPGSFHWEDLWPDCPVTERMPEHVRGPLVRQAIHRCVGAPRAGQLFREGLAAALAGDMDELARRQRAFFDSLGPNGTTRIVQDLAQLC